MFAIESPDLRPSSYELHLHARRQRNRLIRTLARRYARKLAKWLGDLAHQAARVAYNLAVEWCLRRNIDALQKLDDRALGDIGLGRSEIERAVRSGQQSRVNQPSLPQRHILIRTPAPRQAA
jgi:uncharacterized protein YjiS (DUF1127 family)